jgi:archaellum biogenesis ATPase FlaH
MDKLINSDFIEKLTNDGVGMLFVKEREKLDKLSPQLFSVIKNNGLKLIYVTASLPAKVLIERVEDAELEDYLIIDTVTASITDSVQNNDKNIFIRSPGNLTEISINLEDLFRKHKNTVFVVIDSITSLMIYNSENEILRFIHFTSSIAREKKNKLVMVVLDNKGLSESFLDKVRSFIDKEYIIE